MLRRVQLVGISMTCTTTISTHAYRQCATTNTSSSSSPLPIKSVSGFDSEELRKMVRVDLAGEVAAVRICEAQLAWISPLDDAIPIVKEIIEEELVHRETMANYCKKMESTPTVLDPLFAIGAAVMGGATAMLGKDAMMCCHAAVEETITEHYNDQLRSLTHIIDTHDDTMATTTPTSAPTTINKDDDSSSTDNNGISTNSGENIELATVVEFRDTVRKFRDEEMHHQELGENNGAADAPFYPILYPSLVAACKFGIHFGSKY